jgi:hypothetical protein
MEQTMYGLIHEYHDDDEACKQASVFLSPYGLDFCTMVG